LYSCSSVHFEASDEIIEFKKRFREEILSGHGEVEQVIEQHSKLLRYSSTSEFEELLLEMLDREDSEASILALLRKGVIVDGDFFDFIRRILERKTYSVLEYIFAKQPVRIQFEVDMIALLNFILQLNDLRAFEMIWRTEHVTQLAVSTIVEISKEALDLGRIEMIKLIVSSSPHAIRSSVLRSLLKSSMTMERFEIFKLCAVSKIPLIILNLDQRLLALQLSAEMGCEVTTCALLKLPGIKRILEASLDSVDSPLKIAQRKGHLGIFDSLSLILA